MVQVVKALFDITHVTFIVEKLKKNILLDFPGDTVDKNLFASPRDIDLTHGLGRFHMP